jgi:hypothetical protein
MHKNAMECNKTLSNWCKNKHRASKIIDMFGTYNELLQEVKHTRGHKFFTQIQAAQRLIALDPPCLLWLLHRNTSTSVGVDTWRRTLARVLNYVLSKGVGGGAPWMPDL